MATEKSLLERINDSTECLVCSKMMVNPKMLPCIHTFCLECFNRWVEDDIIVCPLCGNKFQIPYGGLEVLPSNTFVQTLIDEQNTQTTDGVVNCDICACRCVEQVAVGFCMECYQKFCDECLEVHAFMNSSKSHQIASIEHIKTSLEDPEKFSESLHCHQHRDRKLEIHCYDCRIGVCTVCFLLEHKRHEGIDLKTFVEREKKRLEENAETVSILSIAVGEQLDLLDTSMVRLSDKAARIEMIILERGEELKRVVDAQARVLVEKLNLEKTNSLANMEDVRRVLQSQQLCLESFTNYSEKVLRQASSSYVVNVAHDMDARAEELKSIKDVDIENYDHDLSFMPSELQDYIADGWNLIGRIGGGVSSSRRSNDNDDDDEGVGIADDDRSNKENDDNDNAHNDQTDVVASDSPDYIADGWNLKTESESSSHGYNNNDDDNDDVVVVGAADDDDGSNQENRGEVEGDLESTVESRESKLKRVKVGKYIFNRKIKNTKIICNYYEHQSHYQHKVKI